MSRRHYVQDTSASRRNRAIYSSQYNAHYDANNNKKEQIVALDLYSSDVIRTMEHTKWDEMSVDSGFSSDLERKVAQLNITRSDAYSSDEVFVDHVTIDDVRAPSRAKLTEEEKRQRTRIKTLPPPGRATRWYRCSDVTEDYSDPDDDTDDKKTQSSSRLSISERKTKSLPLARIEKRRKSISLDDVELGDLRHLRVLGGGGYARVDLVEIRRHPSHRFALKKLNKKLLQDRNQVSHVVSEKDALFRAKSRFIPQLFKTFQTHNHVFMLTEACLGGDLFSVLENHGALPLDVTRYVMACTLEAIDHLHRVLNVIHRDVKTENILIDSNGVAKLGDLGFCKRLPQNCDVTNTFCGTPGYVAPEVLLRNGHGRSCDYFSAGVVMFESATCRSPFRRRCNMETHRATLRGIQDVAFPPFIDHVTIHFIRSLCANNPKQRLGTLGCEQVRRHEYFRGLDWHRLRHGKMTSPLQDLISLQTVNRGPPPHVSDDYTENFVPITKSPYDKTWSENF